MKYVLLVSFILMASASFSQEDHQWAFEIRGSFWNQRENDNGVFYLDTLGSKFRATSKDNKIGLDIFVDGEWKKHGRWMFLEKVIDAPGVFIVYEMEHYKYGVLHGSYESWNNKHSDGLQKRKRQCTYVDGKREGDYLNYHPSGFLEEKAFMVNNLRHGTATRYYDIADGVKQGPVKYIEEYKNGKRDGSKIGYSEDGKEITRSTWSNGVRLD